MDGQSLAGYLQIFSAKTVPSLKSTALGAYFVHAMLNDFTYPIWQWLIENGLTVVWYRPVKSTVEKRTLRVLSEAVRSIRYWFTRTKYVQIKKHGVIGNKAVTRSFPMGLLYVAVGNLFGPLKGCSGTYNNTKVEKHSERCCLPVIVSYCLDIPVKKYISTIKQAFLSLEQRSPFLLLLYAAKVLRTVAFRTIQDNEQVREVFAQFTEKFICTKVFTDENSNMSLNETESCPGPGFRN